MDAVQVADLVADLAQVTLYATGATGACVRRVTVSSGTVNGGTPHARRGGTLEKRVRSQRGVAGV